MTSHFIVGARAVEAQPRMSLTETTCSARGRSTSALASRSVPSCASSADGRVTSRLGVHPRCSNRFDDVLRHRACACRSPHSCPAADWRQCRVSQKNYWALRVFAHEACRVCEARKTDDDWSHKSPISRLAVIRDSRRANPIDNALDTWSTMSMARFTRRRAHARSSRPHTPPSPQWVRSYGARL